MKGAVLLMSGGTDSLCLWHYLIVRSGLPASALACVFMVLGQPWERAELAVLHRLRNLLAARLGAAPEIEINNRLHLGGLIEPETGYVPLRNDLMVRLLAAQGARTIFLGSVADDMFRDHSAAWREAAGAGLSYLCGEPVEISAPLAHLTKDQSVRECAEDERMHEVLLASRSCYRLTVSHVIGATVGCGECRACRRRAQAMAAAGLPTQLYDSHPVAEMHDVQDQ